MKPSARSPRPHLGIGRCAVLACALATAAFGSGHRAWGEPAAGYGQAYTWYDGDLARTVWLDPENVLEFTRPQSVANDAAATRRARAAVVSAVPQALPYAGVRLWKVGRGIQGGTVRAAARMAGASGSGQFTPVFRDQPQARARMRATTGNIEVFFKAPADPVVVQKWARAKNLKILRNLTPGSPTGPGYLVESAPGPDCIQLANKLRQDSLVEAAMPEWWQARQAR